MSQVNVNDPGGDYRRDDDGARWLLPLILGLLALAAIAWLLFANPFGGPTTASPATGTGVTNVAPATGGTGGTTGGTGTTTSPGTGAGTTTSPGAGTGAGTTGGTGTTTGGTGTTGTSGTGTTAPGGTTAPAKP